MKGKKNDKRSRKDSHNGNRADSDHCVYRPAKKKESKRRPESKSDRRARRAAKYAAKRERIACRKIAEKVTNFYGGMGFKADKSRAEGAKEVLRLIAGRGKKDLSAVVTGALIAAIGPGYIPTEGEYEE